MMKPALAAALVAVLPACLLGGGDDDGGDDSPITWRVPCGSHGTWDSGGVEDGRYTHDARRHRTRTELRDETGAVTSVTTAVWDRDDLISSEVVRGETHYRNDVTYVSPGRVDTWTRTDLALDNGDTGFTITYAYAGGDMVGERFDWHDPALPDRESTMTGEHAAVMTIRDCPVGNATDCDEWRWEQPDGDPLHWLSGTGEFFDGVPGAVDVRVERTVDARFLDLVYRESWHPDVDPTASVRFTSTREPDGTEVRTVYEYLDVDTVWATFTRDYQYACASARLDDTAAVRTGTTGATAAAAPIGQRRVTPPGFVLERDLDRDFTHDARFRLR